MICCRAYLLYMAITGAEVQAGSVITAADAATQCEELAKSLKQATPVKAARGSRDRPGLGKACLYCCLVHLTVQKSLIWGSVAWFAHTSASTA